MQKLGKVIKYLTKKRNAKREVFQDQIGTILGRFWTNIEHFGPPKSPKRPQRGGPRALQRTSVEKTRKNSKKGDPIGAPGD